MAFLGPESVWAAEALECAAEQGQFWHYLHRLFDAQAGRNTGVYTKARLKQYAAELGLEQESFNRCVDTERYAQRVRDEIAAGRQLGVDSTPTVFVNGQRVEGPLSFERIRQQVEAAGGR